MHRDLVRVHTELPLLEFEEGGETTYGSELPEGLVETIRGIYGLGGQFDVSTNRLRDEADEE